jgi:hypothetical protein
VLSGKLPVETSRNLDYMLASLETCKALIYRGIREESTSETVGRYNIIPILEGFGKALEAFANLKEWNERMAKEWGERKKEQAR